MLYNFLLYEKNVDFCNVLKFHCTTGLIFIISVYFFILKIKVYQLLQLDRDVVHQNDI